MEAQDENFEKMRAQFAHIPGWGIDADPKDHPNYPYKHYTGDDHKRLNWNRPPQQEKTVEILQSTEHERTPAVFGTVAPPAGLSGVIRKQAFHFSESMIRHWLLLLLADRVDVVESMITDLLHGKAPHWWKEKGLDALWEHDKKLFAKKSAANAAIIGAAAAFVAWMIIKNKGSDAGNRRQPSNAAWV